MEVLGATGAQASSSTLDRVFSTLENELRRHLHTFLKQWAATAGSAASAEEANALASPDVRLMVQNLSKRWDDSGVGRSGRILRLEGSPVISANFATILTALNSYHHKTPTHWEIIDQGFDCAERLLRALQTYGLIDTSQSVSLLLAQRQAVEKVGHLAYDHSVKVLVEEITASCSGGGVRAGGSGDAAAPRLLLQGLPAEADVNAVMWALQAQDVDVTESMIHLVPARGEEEEEEEEGVDTSSRASFVELNSVEEQHALLELGVLTIKRVQVRLVKPEEAREVALYLPKRLEARVIAGAWENEFEHGLAEGRIRHYDDAGQVVIVRLTPKQFAEVEGKTITLLRTQVALLPWSPHVVRLRLPESASPALVTADNLRAVVTRQLAEAQSTAGGGGPVESIVLWPKHHLAFVRLASPAANAQLLQKRHLDLDPASGSGPASAAATTTTITTTSSSSSSSSSSSRLSSSSSSSLSTTPAKTASGPTPAPAQAASKPAVASVPTTPSPAASAPKADEPPVFVLTPLLGAEAMTVERVAGLVSATLGVEAAFIALVEQRAYVRCRAPPAAPSSGKTVISHNGITVNVEQFVGGDIPCWKLGVRTGSAAGKAALTALQTYTKTLADVQPLQVGRALVMFAGVASVEIGTEALFKELLGQPERKLLGQTLTFFDARLDRTEPENDVTRIYYLTMKKKGKPTLTAIEKACLVTINAFWVYGPTTTTGAAAAGPAGRTKQGFIHIVGKSADAVNAAWARLQVHMKTLVRRQQQFKFQRSDALMRACFKEKLKSLYWRGATTAVHVDDPEEHSPSSGPMLEPLVVHVIGVDAVEVAQLAQESNHIRTRLVTELSKSIGLGPQQLDLADFEKTFGVTIAADWAAKKLKVAGFPDDVRTCLSRLYVLAPTAAPAKPAGPATPTAAAPTTATATALPPVAAASGSSSASAQQCVKRIEFAPNEIEAVKRLNLSVVRSKFGVYTKVDLAKRTITFTGPIASALDTACSFVRWFINNGTRQPAAK